MCVCVCVCGRTYFDDAWCCVYVSSCPLRVLAYLLLCLLHVFVFVMCMLMCARLRDVVIRVLIRLKMLSVFVIMYLFV